MAVIGGGFGEEVFFRGFAFERLGKLLGTSPRARMLIVVLTTAWFAAMHIPEQGIYGAEQALITGATFGTLYGATGTLWLPVIAHAAFDVAAVALIYADLELALAQLFFR
jgi:membrane protease YdiL (CAAX protease family)